LAEFRVWSAGDSGGDSGVWLFLFYAA